MLLHFYFRHFILYVQALAVQSVWYELRDGDFSQRQADDRPAFAPQNMQES